MTKEERASISRENGAKSKGPTTEAGKAKSARNALKDGSRAKQFAHFIPPHKAVVCNEDRKAYMQSVDELVAIYKPLNQAAFACVGDMAVARWQIRRLSECITIQWNLALISNANKPAGGNFAPELHEIKAMADASAELLSGKGVLSKLNREVAHLQLVIARLERRIKFIHSNFPDFAPGDKQTRQKEDHNAENEGLNQIEPEENNEEMTPIFASGSSPEVIVAYQAEFPGRRIVIVPRANVNYDGKMPCGPRRAA